MSEDTLMTVRSRATYLYALGAGEAPRPAGLSGLGGMPVERVEIDGLSGFVSAAIPGKLRPERRHLAAHQAVLRSLMESSTVLPVSFGMVLPNRGRLIAMVQAERRTLEEQLQKVAGRVEMSLRLSWDVPNIFQHLVEQDGELRAARDAMIAEGSPHASKVAVGRMFEQAIAMRRHEHQSRIVAALEPLAAELSIETPKTESEIVRLAALVDRDVLGMLEARVHELAEGYDASFRFDYGGPWAPHSFCRLQLDPKPIAEAA